VDRSAMFGGYLSCSRLWTTVTDRLNLERKIWENIDAFGNMYFWQLLLSF